MFEIYEMVYPCAGCCEGVAKEHVDNCAARPDNLQKIWEYLQSLEDENINSAYRRWKKATLGA